jgi:hypothetical protein
MNLLYFKALRTFATNFKSRYTFHRHYMKPRNGFTTAIKYRINPSMPIMSIFRTRLLLSSILVGVLELYPVMIKKKQRNSERKKKT